MQPKNRLRTFIYYLCIPSCVLFHRLSIVQDQNVLSLTLGFFLIGYLPGELALRLLFHRSNPFDKFEVIILKISMSFLIVTALSLVLNLFRRGLDPTYVFSSVWIIIAVLMIVNIFADYYQPAAVEQSTLGEQIRQMWSSSSSTINRLRAYIPILILGALSLVIFVYISINAKVEEHYSEFFVLDGSGKADLTSLNLGRGDPGALILGITNHHLDEQQYSIEAGAGGRSLYKSEPFVVNVGDTYYLPVTINFPNETIDDRVEFWLYSIKNFEPPKTLLLQVTSQ